MGTRRFTELELVAIGRALDVAAGVYDADAETMRKAPGHGHLVQNFEDSSALARKLAWLIEVGDVA